MSSHLEEFDRIFRAPTQPNVSKLADATVIREKARDIVIFMERITASREKSLALTKLQEFVMWANAACLREFRDPD